MLIARKDARMTFVLRHRIYGALSFVLGINQSSWLYVEAVGTDACSITESERIYIRGSSMALKEAHKGIGIALYSVLRCTLNPVHVRLSYCIGCRSYFYPDATYRLSLCATRALRYRLARRHRYVMYGRDGLCCDLLIRHRIDMKALAWLSCWFFVLLWNMDPSGRWCKYFLLKGVSFIFAGMLAWCHGKSLDGKREEKSRHWR